MGFGKLLLFNLPTYLPCLLSTIYVSMISKKPREGVHFERIHSFIHSYIHALPYGIHALSIQEEDAHPFSIHSPQTTQTNTQFIYNHSFIHSLIDRKNLSIRLVDSVHAKRNETKQSAGTTRVPTYYPWHRHSIHSHLHPHTANKPKPTKKKKTQRNLKCRSAVSLSFFLSFFLSYPYPSTHTDSHSSILSSFLHSSIPHFLSLSKKRKKT